MKTSLPYFTGFYNSLLYDNYESEVNLAIDELEESAKEKVYESINYYEQLAKYEQSCCTAFIDCFEDKLKELELELIGSIKFVELDSPQFYNYRNDEIVVDVAGDSIKSIYAYLIENKLELFKAFLKFKCSSYSGFTSFYDNYLGGSNWPEEPTQLKVDSANAELLIQCYLLSGLEFKTLDEESLRLASQELTNELEESTCERVEFCFYVPELVV